LQRVSLGLPQATSRLGDKSTPALRAHVDQLTVHQELTALTKVPKFSSVPGQLRSYDPEQVWRAADASLQAAGLIPSRLHGRYCDGSDQKPVYKLLVSNDWRCNRFFISWRHRSPCAVAGRQANQ
jgi:hypothetical protein